MATLTTTFASSQHPAIVVPGSPALTLTYAQLHSLIADLQSKLAALGIAAHSAVSIALPNNLEFIVSFLAIGAQGAIACPLNPGYKQSEFEFYIDDIKSALVLVPRGAVAANAPAVRAAAKFGAAVAEIYWTGSSLQVDLLVPGSLTGPAPVTQAQIGRASCRERV